MPFEINHKPERSLLCTHTPPAALPHGEPTATLLQKLHISRHSSGNTQHDTLLPLTPRPVFHHLHQSRQVFVHYPTAFSSFASFFSSLSFPSIFSVLFSVMSHSSQPQGLQPARLLCPWDFPGKNTGVGCHFLLQGIFLTQGSSSSLLSLLHWQVGESNGTLLQYSCLENPMDGGAW